MVLRREGMIYIQSRANVAGIHEVDKQCSGTKKTRNDLYPIEVLDERNCGKVRMDTATVYMHNE